MKVRYGASPASDALVRFRVLSGTYPSLTARPATPNASTTAGLTIPAGAPAGIATYTPVDGNNHPVGVPIAAGEYLGAVVPLNLKMLDGPVAGGDAGFVFNSHDSGTQMYVDQARDAAIQGVIEPDADHDGYGDETQDSCPSDASTQGACPLQQQPGLINSPPSNAFAVPSAKAGKHGQANLVLDLPGPGAVDAVATAKVAKAAAKRTIAVAKAHANVTAAGRRVLTLKPTKQGRGALRRLRRLKARVAIKFTPTGGTPRTQFRSLTLRR
jgi:hypothetical protein